MRPASQLLNLTAWVQREFGDWRDGWWECYQFDRVVSWFGRYVENRMNELDKDGHPIYTLEELLTDKDTRTNSPEGLAWLAAQFGVIKR